VADQPSLSAERTRPLEVGLMLPDTELAMGGGSARWSDLQRMAQAAEAMGLYSVWVSDHLLFRFAGQAPQGVWECWSLLAGWRGDAAGGARTAGQLHQLSQSRMIGTTGERLLRPTAQYADLWNAWGLNTPQQVLEARAVIQ
jgi:hypothetical protein